MENLVDLAKRGHRVGSEVSKFRKTHVLKLNYAPNISLLISKVWTFSCINMKTCAILDFDI